MSLFFVNFKTPNPPNRPQSFKCFINAILLFNTVLWFSSLSNHNTMDRIINISSKIVEQEWESLITNQNKSVKSEGLVTAHTLDSYYSWLPSESILRSLIFRTKMEF